MCSSDLTHRNHAERHTHLLKIMIFLHMYESDRSFNPGLSCVGVLVQLLGAFSPEIPLSLASACYLSLQYVYLFGSVSSESVCMYV